MPKKKILLLALTDYDLYESIAENLRKNGFDVTLVLDARYQFRYRNVWQRLDNLRRKIFLGDREHKNRLREKYSREQGLKAVRASGRHDYCLVIRSDFFSTDVLKAAKSCSDRFVSYHYDGLDNSRATIFERIGLFDDFFVFDKNDIEKYPAHNLKLANSFFFDCYEDIRPVSSPRPGIYYRGSYWPSRMDDLLAADTYFVKHKVPAVLEMVCHHQEDRYRFRLGTETNIVIERKILPYRAYLEKMLSHGIILDLVVGEHGGFSFRIFESLHYRKKAVTTNKNVLEMDFYHENNFFVVQDGDYEGLLEFMDKPYVDIDPKIVEKYGFTNWINTILGIKSVQNPDMMN